jgi:hypothetical protein
VVPHFVEVTRDIKWAYHSFVIARFRILLPFTFSIREGDQFPPIELSRSGSKVRIYPPVTAHVEASAIDVRTTSLQHAIELVRPADAQPVRREISIDGRATIAGSLLQIDFLKNDFDRPNPRNAAEITALWEGGDPSGLELFRVANGFLAAVRTVVRGPYIRDVTANSCFWRLDYLADDGTAVPRQEGLHRWRWGGPIPAIANPLYADAWTVLGKVGPEYIPPTWDTLLLDAYAALPAADALIPQVGASIVLAFTALETFITAALNELAQEANVPAEFWDWMAQRGGDPDRQPKLEEKFDQLLKHLSGHSLREEARLWKGFTDLRNARNKFAHEGVARIGDLHVSTELAKLLVSQAEEIVNWIEHMLPESMRRPKVERLPTLTITAYPMPTSDDAGTHPPM